MRKEENFLELMQSLAIIRTIIPFTKAETSKREAVGKGKYLFNKGINIIILF